MPWRPKEGAKREFRHTCASALPGAGIDLYTVGKLLGHVNVASTARYAHLANDTLMAASEAGAVHMLDVSYI